VIHEAASVILLRAAAGGFELFLVRRHRNASFMASSYVFPGGIATHGEDARTTAARELFEEAGVLLAKASPDLNTVPSYHDLRKQILDGKPATEMLRSVGLAWSTQGLVPWSHWITPSIEPRRYAVRFFVAELPAGQEPSHDATETVDQIWLTPAEALARAGDLQLPPPQVRTCWELNEFHDVPAVLNAGRKRAEEPHPILPRMAPAERPCLLLPWDPDYTRTGTGDAVPLTYRPSWATGPSRFVLEDKTWTHVAAPGSTSAG
jgi:8-oxo-dGTP pyrophosphatase MutT (NUDIX family)